LLGGDVKLVRVCEGWRWGAGQGAFAVSWGRGGGGGLGGGGRVGLFSLNNLVVGNLSLLESSSSF